ncbi:MAG: hypothetical protein ABI454_04785 [Sphingomicrobium sp.]
MDLEQLIKQRDELVAAAGKILEGEPAIRSLQRPLELQEAHAARVEARIASLETARAEFAKSIDLEVKELKGDLEQRRRKIALVRKEFGNGSAGKKSSPSGRAPARAGTPAATSRKTAKSAPARKPGAASKATKGNATRRAPRGKNRGSE